MNDLGFFCTNDFCQGFLTCLADIVDRFKVNQQFFCRLRADALNIQQLIFECSLASGFSVFIDSKPMNFISDRPNEE